MSEREPPFLTFAYLNNEETRKLAEEDPASEKAYSAFAKAELYRIKAESERDTLTQVYTREAFCNKLDQTLAQLHVSEARRSTDIRAIIVFFIDVWKFKDINEDFSYEVGDESLKIVCGCIQAALRSEDDMVGRHSGDQFLVSVPLRGECDPEAVTEDIKQRIESALAIYNTEKGEEEPELELTIGSTVMLADSPETTDQLIAKAGIEEQNEKRRQREKHGVERRQE